MVWTEVVVRSLLSMLLLEENNPKSKEPSQINWRFLHVEEIGGSLAGYSRNLGLARAPLLVCWCAAGVLVFFSISLVGGDGNFCDGRGISLPFCFTDALQGWLSPFDCLRVRGWMGIMVARTLVRTRGQSICCSRPIGDASRSSIAGGCWQRS